MPKEIVKDLDLLIRLGYKGREEALQAAIKHLLKNSISNKIDLRSISETLRRSISPQKSKNFQRSRSIYGS